MELLRFSPVSTAFNSPVDHVAKINLIKSFFYPSRDCASFESIEVILRGSPAGVVELDWLRPHKGAGQDEFSKPIFRYGEDARQSRWWCVLALGDCFTIPPKMAF